MTCSRKIIEQIKVIGQVEDFEANNGVIFEDGVLQFGGMPLIHDTALTGNFKLEFGTLAGRINQFIARTQNLVSFEAYNGVVSTSIQLSNTGITVGDTTPNGKGLKGNDNFSPYYDDYTYIQKIYADQSIAGHPITTEVRNPGAPQNGHTIAWNQPLQRWVMQTVGAAPTVGTDKQVIFNEDGVLVGHPHFTFHTESDYLFVPNIGLGTDDIGGNVRFINVYSSDSNAALIIQPKAAGDLYLGVHSGRVLIGTAGSVNTIQEIQAIGAAAQVDISLEPKGTDGVVFIGNDFDAGAYRYLKTRGNSGTLHFRIQSKGTGQVILEPAHDTDGSTGMVKIGHGTASVGGVATKQLLAESDFVTTNLEIGGTGANSVVCVGLSSQVGSTRFLSPASSSADCNLNIIGKGLGLVAVNGFVRSKKIAIVNWNMNSTGGFSVAHGFGISDWSKIISVEAVIRNDFGGDVGPLGRIVAAGEVEGGVAFWDNAAVYINRRVGGIFQSSLYDSTGGYIRGWIYINYEL